MGKLSREDMIARRTENAKTRYTGDYVNNITQKTPVVNDNINTGNHNLNPKLQNIQFQPIDNKKRAEKLAEMVEKRKINRIPHLHNVNNSPASIKNSLINEANNFILLLKELDKYETLLLSAENDDKIVIQNKITELIKTIKPTIPITL